MFLIEVRPFLIYIFKSFLFFYELSICIFPFIFLIELYDNMGKKGRGHQGPCIKDIWTKPKSGRFKGGGWGGQEGGELGGGMKMTVLEQQ